MRRSLLCGLLGVTALAVTGAGCSESTTPPTTPTTPSEVTETFTGTLTLNGSVTFPYVVSQAGATNATIKDMTPYGIVTVKAGGTGAFQVGEKIYQGESPDTATWSAVVHAWTPGVVIAINSMTGIMAVDGDIIGATSGAVWKANEVTSTVVGLSLGTWSGTTCSIVLRSDTSGVGSQIAGQVQGAGSLCASVYDVGKLTGPATFTIEVTHY